MSNNIKLSVRLPTCPCTLSKLRACFNALDIQRCDAHRSRMIAKDNVSIS